MTASTELDSSESDSDRGFDDDASLLDLVRDRDARWLLRDKNARQDDDAPLFDASMVRAAMACGNVRSRYTAFARIP